MPYTLTASDGSINITVPDGTADTSTNLVLPGPNYVGYGQKLNENLLSLLTNFASNSAPTGNNVLGQLYFSKIDQVLKVFTAQGFTPISGIIADNSQPVIGQPGTIWFNTTTGQLYVYNNGTYNLIGPFYTASEGQSGAIPVVIEDQSTLNHNVVKIQFGTSIFAIFNPDVGFIPQTAITGFPFINQGLTLNNTYSQTALNTNVVGNLTGNVVGNLTGNVVGNLTGNVTSSSAVITGGSVNGISTLSATSTQTANFSTGNAQITGGAIAGITSLSATNLTSTNSTATTLVATNFSTGNAQITGGNATSIGTLTATTANLTSLSVTNESVTTSHATNFSTGNAQITGGNATVTNLTAVNEVTTTLVAANFSTGNAQITGGNATVTNAIATTVHATVANIGVIGASTLNAALIGNTGAVIVGTITTPSQTNITQVGSLSQGALVSGFTPIGTAMGGTGFSGATPFTSGGAVYASSASALTTGTLPVPSGGTGVTTLSGIVYANGTSAFTTANATQIVSTIGTVAVTNATNAVTAANATAVATSNFTMFQSNNRLYFAYNGTPIASLDSNGNFASLNNITANQTSGLL
jgi:hypothetical protein